ncbi:WD40/YVTN/BNR-like repeat-containing protein [Paraflavitalea pollutisoli]|uniref:WD40/YVTN/BNR-like repeat-containing protein n=1 Tax=Paraflavitalea pollutisoli TaxID=3034143 RepID=UPI0023EB2892|nr:IPT/TIG domain-containing protein [Paraflavitalea sp. H1-2-19X]
MKFFYLLLLATLFFSVSNQPQAQMRQLSMDEANPDNELKKFSFYTAKEGYAAFTRWIGYTTDSGRSFIRKNITLSNVNFNGYPVNLTFGFGINGVCAFNKDTLVVYGDYGLVPSILYSVDQGNTFKLIYHARYDPMTFKTGITDMVFPENSNVGFAVDADRILRTSNKGVSWSVVKLDVSRFYDHLEAVDNNNVFAFSKQYNTSKMFKTADGGNSWAEVVTPAGRIIYSSFLTANKGWLNLSNDGRYGEVYYTSNGGRSWTLKNDASITPFGAIKMRFVNDSTGYGISGAFDVFKTSDSGKVWEPLQREQRYTYLNYSHNDLQVINADQLWAGGGHGLVEISTNGGGVALPRSFFRTDTTGVGATGTVSLRNYSKPNYQYKWYLNDTLISTGYHANYKHDKLRHVDTVTLIVSNGVNSDTMTSEMYFPAVWVTSFTPTTAAQQATVTINGYNFTGTTQVRFGGVPASSFTVVSNTQLKAVVGYGASGNIEVFAPRGVGTLGGFTYLGDPRTDLPTSIADSILCKSERIKISIERTEPGVYYYLMGPKINVIGGTVTGNGGTVTLVTDPVSESGIYSLVASRTGTTSGDIFQKRFNILVEHTTARFVADQLNITPGEAVSFAGLHGDAQNYYWTFYQDASTTTASGTKIADIRYSTPGQKTLRLISVSANGCADTATNSAVFVFQDPGMAVDCSINPLETYSENGMSMVKVMGSHDNGTYVIGATEQATELRSNIGLSKKFEPGSHSFLARYTEHGVLKWAQYFKPNGGVITAGQTDAQGNIYLTGYAISTQWFYFRNGDSMRIYVSAADTTNLGERTHGFVMKLDRNGQYLWHTILFDHTSLYQGYIASASGHRIAIKDDNIVVIGAFLSKLSYVQNKVAKQLYDMPGTYYRGYQNYAVLKIKDDGTLLWNGLLSFQANNWHSLSDIAIDKTGNCYLVGSYEEYLGIYDAASVEQVKLKGTVARHKAFFVSFGATGFVRWYNNFLSSYEYGETGLKAVIADEAGNTYLAGSMFNWGRPVGIDIQHSDGTVVRDSLAAFALYKFDNAGKRQWGVGSRYPYYGEASALCLNGNEIFVSGKVSNNGESFGSFVLTSSDGNQRNLSIFSSEGLVARYDTAGRFKRVYTSGYNYNAQDFSITSMFINHKQKLVFGGYARAYLSGIINRSFGVIWPHAVLNGDGYFMSMNTDFCNQAVTADAGPDKISCSGDTVSIGSMASGNIYSWSSNPVGFTSTQPNPTPRPRVNTHYFLKVTSENGSVAYDTVYVTVKQSPIADAGRDTTICSRSSVLIGSPAIAGNSYQWFEVTFGPIDKRVAQFTVNPTWSTAYAVRVLGPNGCPAYDTVRIATIPADQPVVAVQTTNNTICKGATVQFNALSYFLGQTPTYQWQLNGINVGSNTDTYVTDSLKNGDGVSLSVVNDNVCASVPVTHSNKVYMTVMEKVNATISIEGGTIVNAGEKATVNALPTNAGTGYRVTWQDSTGVPGWQDLPASGSPLSYEYRPQKSGDKVRAKLFLTLECAANNPVYSQPMQFVVNTITSVGPVPATQSGIRFYPNPAQEFLVVDSLRLQDQWQELVITQIDGRRTSIKIPISSRTQITVPLSTLGRGMHVAILRNKKGMAIYFNFMKL